MNCDLACIFLVANRFRGHVQVLLVLRLWGGVHSWRMFSPPLSCKNDGLSR